MAKTVTLYHFTCEHHLPKIMTDGYLKTTESNLSITRPHAGPDVDWLGTMPEMRPGGSYGLSDGTKSIDVEGRNVLLADKTAIRFTVEVPARDAHKWDVWARRWGMHKRTFEAFQKAAPNSKQQRMVERPITSTEWVEVRHMHTGEVFDWTDPTVVTRVQKDPRFTY